NGPPPTSRHEAAHLCGNGAGGCVSGAHLAWKTPKENIADQLVHGTRPRGEKRGNAKLTEADVREIRKRTETETLSALAKHYGVAPSLISRIKSRDVWAWLE